jgi:hypothetical protein
VRLEGFIRFLRVPGLPYRCPKGVLKGPYEALKRALRAMAMSLLFCGQELVKGRVDHLGHMAVSRLLVEY